MTGRAALADALRDRLNERLGKLRAELESLPERRKAAMTRALSVCAARRVELAELAKKRRAETLAALREKETQEREAAAEACDVRKARVRAGTKGKRKQLVQEAYTAREDYRGARAVERSRGKRRRKNTGRRQESDDFTAQEIPPELLSVWRRVKSRIGAKKNMRRDEAFFHWVHENPEVVAHMQAKEGEKLHEAQIRELRKAERAAMASERALAAQALRDIARELRAGGVAAPLRTAKLLARGKVPRPAVAEWIAGRAREMPLAARVVAELQASAPPF